MIAEYLSARDIQDIVGVGKSKACEVVHKLNDELAADGYIIFPGNVPKKYFLKRTYGVDDVSGNLKVEYLDAEDIQNIFGLGRTKAYDLVRKLNKELSQHDNIVFAGKVPKKYLLERTYGLDLGGE